MGTRPIQEISRLEGMQVGIALRDGSRIDDATLVSARTVRTGTLWLVSGGVDVFVPASAVVDAWEWRTHGRRAA